MLGQVKNSYQIKWAEKKKLNKSNRIMSNKFKPNQTTLNQT